MINKGKLMREFQATMEFLDGCNEEDRAQHLRCLLVLSLTDLCKIHGMAYATGIAAKVINDEAILMIMKDAESQPVH